MYASLASWGSKTQDGWARDVLVSVVALGGQVDVTVGSCDDAFSVWLSAAFWVAGFPFASQLVGVVSYVVGEGVDLSNVIVGDPCGAVCIEINAGHIFTGEISTEVNWGDFNVVEWKLGVCNNAFFFAGAFSSNILAPGVGTPVFAKSPVISGMRP